MTMRLVEIPLDSELAQIYSDASEESQKKVQVLLDLYLREVMVLPSSTPLETVMDTVSKNAQARGLTPEVLDSILNNE